jgi:hypothetical protein
VSSPRAVSSRSQGVRAALGAHDPVPVAVVAAEVAGDGAADRAVVVDGEQDGSSGHGTSGLGSGTGHPVGPFQEHLHPTPSAPPPEPVG